ncbi:MAG: Hsp20/alpha crystallin family protein [Bacteroidota bacterium]
MTLVLKRNGNLFPRVVNDLMESGTVFSPDLLDFNNNLMNWDFSSKVPSVNITETEKEYKIELAAPGLEKKDFKIEVENKVLIISSEKEEEKKEEDKNYKRREFSYSSFSRSFQLPEDILSDKIDAKYENGILKLSVPKKEVSVSKQKKEIKIS